MADLAANAHWAATRSGSFARDSCTDLSDTLGTSTMINLFDCGRDPCLPSDQSPPRSTPPSPLPSDRACMSYNVGRMDGTTANRPNGGVISLFRFYRSVRHPGVEPQIPRPRGSRLWTGREDTCARTSECREPHWKDGAECYVNRNGRDHSGGVRDRQHCPPTGHAAIDSGVRGQTCHHPAASVS